MAGGWSRDERLTIGPPARALEAVLALSKGKARAGAVVAHPHPEYGGTMDNPVVVAIARALAAEEFAALRFNFGGVGRSGGQFTGGPGEMEDVRAALDALVGRLPDLPMALVGYSFGAWAAVGVAAGMVGAVRQIVAVGPPLSFLDWDRLGLVTLPVTFVVGDRDQYCPPDRLEAVLGASGGRIACRQIAGADHFFAGQEGEVAAVVAEVLRDLA